MRDDKNIGNKPQETGKYSGAPGMKQPEKSSEKTSSGTVNPAQKPEGFRKTSESEGSKAGESGRTAQESIDRDKKPEMRKDEGDVASE